MFKVKLNKRGQVTSLDLVISMFVFLVILIFVISLWSLFSSRLSENVANEELQLVAFQVSDILMKSRGIPDNWEDDPNSTIIFGLRDNYRYLDENKITAFTSLDYNLIKQRFNIERFDFLIEFIDGDEVEYSSGLSPEDAEHIIAVTRYAIVGIDIYEIVFTLWTK